MTRAESMMTERGSAADLTPKQSACRERAAALFDEAVRMLSESPPRVPVSTYRLQMHAGFRFEQARAIVPYLHELGITDAYLSPYLAARPGSTHGYDVFDHSRINPEIGTPDDHDRLLATLAEHGMERVVDVVPNHMGIAGGNRFWTEVLEDGPQAASAPYFDIDWHPVKDELEGRVLLPVLGDQYGRVLEDGQLTLRRDGGRFWVDYYDTHLPLSPRSYADVLRRGLDDAVARLSDDRASLVEYRSILASIENLPPRDTNDPDAIERYRGEKESIRRRIGRLCEEIPAVQQLLDEVVDSFRGTPGDPTSFDGLHLLLEKQVYRLASWRVAYEEINYRRFFDVNELAGVRTEDPAIFAEMHRLVLEWTARGGVSALRIDHPDGLADPLDYFRRLQEAVFLARCRSLSEDANWPDLEPAIRELFASRIEAEPHGPLRRACSIVVEKILSRNENLPDDWPVDGTVGYGFLNALNGLFVDPSGQSSLESSYAEFTGDTQPWQEVVYQSKLLISRASLASELNMIARALNRISEHDRHSRDFTLNDLRRALREVMACFPVYRTYIRPGEPVGDRDRAVIEAAVSRARSRNRAIDRSVYDFVKSALLLEHPSGATDDERAALEQFVVRFQQLTGPLTAKGVEDTAFYRQIKLASLNEVGGDPTRFGIAPATFHAVASHRLSNWPGIFSPTATHDTKRGEDTRLRIDVLSELPEEWRVRLNRWSYWNSRKKSEVAGSPVPDAREEHVFYQNLVGAWPGSVPYGPLPDGFVDRMKRYMSKALREAKLNMSWTDQDPTYGDAVSKFVGDVLEGEGSDIFLRDFVPFQRRISRIAMVHSLSQVLLRVASPGVPDTYQGGELWDLSLVDPDNRRPVDYDLRAQILRSLRQSLDQGTSRRELAAQLLDDPDSGAIKLYVLWTALSHRRDDPDLYLRGTYRPIDASGPSADKLISFGRAREGRYVGVVAPRLVSGLMGDDGERLPVGDAWQGTRLLLPAGLTQTRWVNRLTGEVIEARDLDGQTVLDVPALFATLPLALLAPDR